MKLPAPAVVERTEESSGCSQVTRSLQHQGIARTREQDVVPPQLDIGCGALQQEGITIRCETMQ